MQRVFRVKRGYGTLKKDRWYKFIRVALFTMATLILFTGIITLVGSYSSISDKVTIDDMVINGLISLFDLTIESDKIGVFALIVVLILMLFSVIFYIAWIIALIVYLKEQMNTSNPPDVCIDHLDDGDAPEHFGPHFDVNYDEPTDNYQPLKKNGLKRDELKKQESSRDEK